MQPIDWIIIGVAAVAVVGIIISLIVDKKKGKSGCGSCSGKCSTCPSMQKKGKK